MSRTAVGNFALASYWVFFFTVQSPWLLTLSRKQLRAKSQWLTPTGAAGHNPASELIKIILMRPFGNDFSVMVHELQMRWGLSQSWQ